MEACMDFTPRHSSSVEEEDANPYYINLSGFPFGVEGYYYNPGTVYKSKLFAGMI